MGSQLLFHQELQLHHNPHPSSAAGFKHFLTFLTTRTVIMNSDYHRRYRLTIWSTRRHLQKWKTTFFLSTQGEFQLCMLGFQFLLEITWLGVIYYIQKDSWSLDAQNPPKKCFTFENFCSSERRLTQLVRVPPYEILVFLTNFIFFGETR